MLTSLRIHNFAIIDELQIHFSEGLTVVTGETGAGKSIIMGALGFVLGDRATPDLIRTGEDEALVEVIFDIRYQDALRMKLSENDMYDGDDLILKRVMTRSGRNKILVNGYPATLGMLAQYSGFLFNICGQREHQVFLNPEKHLDIIDHFALLMPQRESYYRGYEAYLRLQEEYRELEKKVQSRDERQDFLSFQLNEIDQAGFAAGDEENLLAEKQMLANIQKLKEHSDAAYECLYGKEGSVLELMRSSQTEINAINTIDGKFPLHSHDLEALYFQLEEMAFILRDYCRALVDDPSRLAVVEERLELLGKLKRKHGKTIDEILKKREEIFSEREELFRFGENLEEMNAILDTRRHDLHAQARALSLARQKASSEMAALVEEELKTLKMNSVVFQVHCIRDDTSLGPKGYDQVEFYLSTNMGESLKPMVKIVSGGELSRIILAMKRIMMKTDPVGTMIFDEVDSGIGGRTADVIGEKLRELASRHQVLCITHLPQIARFGDQHFSIAKEIKEGRTHVRLHVLSPEERVNEIARMLGDDDFRGVSKEWLEKSPSTAKGKGRGNQFLL